MAGNIQVQLKGQPGATGPTGPQGPAGANSSPAAPLRAVQFNSASTFGGNRGLLYDPTLFTGHGELLIQDASGTGNRSTQYAFSETGGLLGNGYGFLQAYNFDAAQLEDFIVEGNNTYSIFATTYSVLNANDLMTPLVLVTGLDASIGDVNLIHAGQFITCSNSLGLILMSNLPNSDPGISGALYRDTLTGAVFQSL